MVPKSSVYTYYTRGRRILIALGFKIERFYFPKILTPQNFGGQNFFWGGEIDLNTFYIKMSALLSVSPVKCSEIDLNTFYIKMSALLSVSPDLCICRLLARYLIDIKCPIQCLCFEGPWTCPVSRGVPHV